MSNNNDIISEIDRLLSLIGHLNQVNKDTPFYTADLLDYERIIKTSLHLLFAKVDKMNKATQLYGDDKKR